MCTNRHSLLGRHFIQRIDNIGSRISGFWEALQRDLANHVRQEILEGLPVQRFHILGNPAQKLLDLVSEMSSSMFL